MANDVINPADQPVYQAGASAERKRLHDAFRRIVAAYRDGRSLLSENPELTIRRAIEEVFEAPIPWQEEVVAPERKPRR